MPFMQSSKRCKIHFFKSIRITLTNLMTSYSLENRREIKWREGRQAVYIDVQCFISDNKIIHSKYGKMLRFVKAG